MSQILKQVLAANAAYAKDFGNKADLAIPPVRRFAVLTCMDARIDPAKLAGFAEGDAHVIRNAGGRASDDAIRSLIISHKLLGTTEWFVIHHTDCGMGMFTDETIRRLLSHSLETASLGPDGWRDTGKGPGSDEAEFIDWLTFKDPGEAVLTDIRRIRAHPLVPDDIPIYGYIYDVRSGRLVEVPGAQALGGRAQRPRTAAKRAGRASAKQAPAKPSAAAAASRKLGAAAAKQPAPAAASQRVGAAAKQAAATAEPVSAATAKKVGAAAKQATASAEWASAAATEKVGAAAKQAVTAAEAASVAATRKVAAAAKQATAAAESAAAAAAKKAGAAGRQAAGATTKIAAADTKKGAAGAKKRSAPKKTGGPGKKSGRRSGSRSKAA